MQLSIIIPTKNEEKNLPELLDSIKKQTFTDYEIIVADADSEDKTVEIAKRYGAKVVKGGMPGVGRNNGAKVARGDILLFLDADVELRNKDFLQKNLEEMKKRGVIVATVFVRPISKKPIDHILHDAYNLFALAVEKVRPHAPGFCIFIKKHAHQEINGFDKDVVMAEDHDYVYRAYKAGYRFRILHSKPIYVSVRRLQKDGRLNIALKYMMNEMQMVLKGPIKEINYKTKVIDAIQSRCDVYDFNKLSYEDIISIDKTKMRIGKYFRI